jgi:ankyrin repeat protein
MSKLKTIAIMLAMALAMFAPVLLAHGGEIHDAAEHGDVEKIKELLKENPDLVNAKGYNGLTPLHFAANEGHLNAVELLLANKADVNARADYGSTALYLATFYGHKEVVEMLLAHKADPDVKNNEGWTPLAWAEDHGQQDIAGLLRQHGARIGDPPAIRQWNIANSGVAKPEIVLCQNDEAWGGIWQRISHAVPSHLLTNQLGIAIFLGQRPTGGYSASVMSAQVVAGSYVVRYKEESPHGFVTEAITTPCLLVIVPATNFPVKVTKEEEAKPGDANLSGRPQEPSRDEVDRLKANLKTLQEENEGYQARITNLESNNKELSKELKNAQEAIETLKAELRRVEDAVGKPGLHPLSQP